VKTRRLRGAVAFPTPSLGSILGALALAVFALITGGPGLAYAFLLLFGAVSAFLWRRRYVNAFGGQEFSVEECEEGLAINEAFILSRKAITQAYVLPSPGGRAKVRVFAKPLPKYFDVEVDDTNDGIRLLRALGRDTSHATMEFAVYSPWRSPGLALLGISAVVLGIAVHPGILVVGLALIFLLLRFRRALVGADGVQVPQRFGDRFIPYTELRDVKKAPGGARLVLVSGKELSIDVIAEKGEELGVMVSALYERLREARRAIPEAAALDVSALVAPAGRSAREWLSALRKLRDREVGYRTSGIGIEHLWRIVEDAGASAAIRAGAAAALSSTLDGQGRARLRVAADATAAPELRVVLERSAAETPDDQGLTEALSAVCDLPSQSAVPHK
jgi:hypothetical protein